MTDPPQGDPRLAPRPNYGRLLPPGGSGVGAPRTPTRSSEGRRRHSKSTTPEKARQGPMAGRKRGKVAFSRRLHNRKDSRRSPPPAQYLLTGGTRWAGQKALARGGRGGRELLQGGGRGQNNNKTLKTMVRWWGCQLRLKRFLKVATPVPRCNAGNSWKPNLRGCSSPGDSPLILDGWQPEATALSVCALSDRPYILGTHTPQDHRSPLGQLASRVHYPRVSSEAFSLKLQQLCRAPL